MEDERSVPPGAQVLPSARELLKLHAHTRTVAVHTMPSVDAGWNQEICLGESILLDATAAGDSTAMYTFSWSTVLGLNDPYLEDPTATPPMTTTFLPTFAVP